MKKKPMVICGVFLIIIGWLLLSIFVDSSYTWDPSKSRYAGHTWPDEPLTFCSLAIKDNPMAINVIPPIESNISKAYQKITGIL